MDLADEIWNRAAVEGGGRNPGQGDTALASVLRLHSLAMNAGLVDAIERLGEDELDAAEAGYQWIGLGEAATVVARIRAEIEAGALDDDARAEALEESADADYSGVIPADGTIEAAFRARLADQPDAFLAP